MKRTSKTKHIRTHHQTVAQYGRQLWRFPRIRSVFWLFRCSDALNKYMSMEAGEKGDNRTELSVLQILLKYPQGVSQQVIANETGRTKQAIVVVIDNLVKKGYVIRCTNDHDRRINSIKITQNGLDHLSEILPHEIKICNQALSSLSDSEVDQLLPLMIKVTKNLWEKIES